MKNIFIFLILVVSSYSNNLSLDVLALDEDLQVVVPTKENKTSNVSFILNTNKLNKDIYLSDNQVVLTNDKEENLILDDGLEWEVLDDNILLIVLDNSSKTELIEFFNNSEELDLKIYKTNVMYTLEDLQIEEFKSNI